MSCLVMALRLLRSIFWCDFLVSVPGRNQGRRFKIVSHATLLIFCFQITTKCIEPPEVLDKRQLLRLQGAADRGEYRQAAGAANKSGGLYNKVGDL